MRIYERIARRKRSTLSSVGEGGFPVTRAPIQPVTRFCCKGMTARVYGVLQFTGFEAR